MNNEGQAIKTTEPVIVSYIHQRQGVSKKGRTYTAYSLKLIPFRGDGVEVSDEEAIWISSGFKAPKIQVGDLVTVNYIEAGDDNQWKNLDSFEYVTENDKPTTQVINNIDITQDIPY